MEQNNDGAYAQKHVSGAVNRWIPNDPCPKTDLLARTLLQASPLSSTTAPVPENYLLAQLYSLKRAQDSNVRRTKERNLSNCSFNMP